MGIGFKIVLWDDVSEPYDQSYYLSREKKFIEILGLPLVNWEKKEDPLANWLIINRDNISKIYHAFNLIITPIGVRKMIKKPQTKCVGIQKALHLIRYPNIQNDKIFQLG